MGYTRVRVRISNPDDRTRLREVELLVDTGAIYTVISRKTLEELGVVSRERMEFYSISNQRLQRDVGVALIEVHNRRWISNVIFGEEGDNEALGVTTLEQLALQVDPVTKELKPLPLYLL